MQVSGCLRNEGLADIKAVFSSQELVENSGIFCFKGAGTLLALVAVVLFLPMTFSLEATRGIAFSWDSTCAAPLQCLTADLWQR